MALGVGVAIMPKSETKVAKATSYVVTDPISTMAEGTYLATVTINSVEYYLDFSNGLVSKRIKITALGDTDKSTLTDSFITTKSVTVSESTKWAFCYLDGSTKHYIGAVSGETYFTESTTTDPTSADTYLLWTVSDSFGFTNVGQSTRCIRANGTTDLRNYASGTAISITLYKVEEAKTVDHVNLKTGASKTLYKIGDTFNPAGVSVTVCFDTGETDKIDVTYSNSTAAKFKFSGFNSTAAANNQAITVQYAHDGSTWKTAGTTFNVNIVDASPVSVTANFTNVDSNYQAGEKLNMAGLAVTLAYQTTPVDYSSLNENWTIQDNADFVAKGLTLKLSGAAFDLDTALTSSHDDGVFTLFYGSLSDNTHTLTIDVANTATFEISDFSATYFWSSVSTTTYAPRSGVVASNGKYAAFDGSYSTANSMQMNEVTKNSYFENAIELGTIVSVKIEMSANSATQFTMYYGNTVSPTDGTKTIATPSDTGELTYEFIYDFSAVSAKYFRLAKTTKGSVSITNVTITYEINASLDRTEAGAYSDYFLRTTNGLCDEDGIENGVAGVWAKLNGVFGKLSTGSKDALKAKALAEKGVSDGSTIGEAMARYYWAVKNHDNTDFVGGGDIKAATRAIETITGKKESYTAIIIVISSISLVALGGFLVIRRKKEQ